MGSCVSSSALVYDPNSGAYVKKQKTKTKLSTYPGQRKGTSVPLSTIGSATTYSTHTGTFINHHGLANSTPNYQQPQMGNNTMPSVPYNTDTFGYDYSSTNTNNYYGNDNNASTPLVIAEAEPIHTPDPYPSYSYPSSKQF